jgi:hypothetical protein
LPETGEFGLYDIDHLRQFWTHLRSQSDNESTDIIEVMREEKQMLMQKIHNYEREAADREAAGARVKELEA